MTGIKKEKTVNLCYLPDFFGKKEEQLRLVRKIIEKLIYKREKILFFCEKEKDVALLDEFFWINGKKNSFLPHATIKDDFLYLENSLLIIGNKIRIEYKCDVFLYLEVANINIDELVSFNKIIILSTSSKKIRNLYNKFTEQAFQIKTWMYTENKWKMLVESNFN